MVMYLLCQVMVQQEEPVEILHYLVVQLTSIVEEILQKMYLHRKLEWDFMMDNTT